MKRILINATHNEEVRVALCKDNHLYDFDLENRTREQKKANIYKGHITRVEPSLEAVFVEYGSARQGFLPLREIAPEYLKGNLHGDNIKQLIKEGDEIIVQVEKEERGNKGAALSTFISLAGRYLVLMPNNSKGGGISRQISGKVRDEMKQIIASLSIPQGMSVIVRTAGLGKGFDDLQNDLDHLLDIWASILEQNKKRPSPCLVHQEAGVVTRAMRDYLRDDIGEIWIDSEHAYNEAANFIATVMPSQMGKLRKYTDYEPLFSRFGIERQIETAYQREVRLPSGGSIVIDQTEAMVAIDINSAKSTKGSDVAETAYHTNLEAADEIARQLRLRDMGGLIVIDFIDMNDARHQKDVEKRLIDATRYDRARVQFAEISKFGLMEMSRQRLRPSLEESTGYICPRCHGNGMIRDLRSLALSIMRQIEQIALKERMGEIQAEVPTDIAAFLLNEKRESLVYLEQDSGTRVTILPHAHLESPNFSLHFNPNGFAPSSYERIADTEERETIDRGYDVNWQTKNEETDSNSRWQKATSSSKTKPAQKSEPTQQSQPQVVAWLSNLFAPKPQAKLASSLNSTDVAAAIESIVNDGGVSLGAFGTAPAQIKPADKERSQPQRHEEERKYPKPKKTTPKRELKEDNSETKERSEKQERKPKKEDKPEYPKREANSQREPRGEVVRGETLKPAQKPPRVNKKDVEKTGVDKPQKSDKITKAVDGDKVVLRISPISQPQPPSKTVRLCLDGDNDNQPDSKQAPTEPTKAVVAVQENKESSSVIADDVDTATCTQQTVQTANKQHTADSGFAQVDSVRLNTLALQMNKVINDPRVVAAYYSHNDTINLAQLTAGEFVQKVLNRRSEQFVVDFLAAITQYRATQNVRPSFDFANYGYAPLDDDYLTNFYQHTTPQNQKGVPQGKTAVQPQPISKRASNDPRGQHPSLIATSDAITDDTSLTQDEPTEISNINQTNDWTVISQDEQVASQLVNHDTSHTDALKIQPSVETPALVVNHTNGDDISEDVSDIQKVATAHDDNDNATSDTTADVSAKDQPSPSKLSSDTTNDRDKTAKATNKTDKPASSYKDMIESVSGQLLQPVGILSLVAPKKPKTSKPKSTTKSPAKKTSKAAQKAQVVKRKATKNDGSGGEVNSE